MADNKKVNNGTLFDYKCPCCGGTVEFSSELQKLKCPYCDSVFEVDNLRDYDDLLNKDTVDNIEWEKQNRDWNDGETNGMYVYTCNSCGGEIVCEETTAASFCPYCGNPVVMAGRLSGALKPDYIIPFKLNKEQAKTALYEHTRKKKLLPKLFKDLNHIDEIKGMYIPFWLFDTDSTADALWKGTKVRHWSDSKYDYTETSYYSVYRKGHMMFENVPVDGLFKVDNSLMESIEPYDFSEAVDFSTAYLSGYLADRYDEDESSCEERANSRVKLTSETVLRNSASGYSSLVTESNGIELAKGKTKYVLYPVWLLNTTWNGGNYLFAMNGQTGKMVGNLPVDKKQYFKWLLIYLVIFGAIALGAIFLFWRFMS